MSMTLDYLPQGKARVGLPAQAVAATLAAALGLAVWQVTEPLDRDARIVLSVAALAIVGWVGSRLPDSLVALIAALALVITGAQPQEALTRTLGEEIVWLLIAAFVIAAVVRQSGLAQRLVAPLT